VNFKARVLGFAVPHMVNKVSWQVQGLWQALFNNPKVSI